MPLAHIHLLHLSPSLPLPTAIRLLAATNPPPLTISRVIRWIILPSTIDSSSLLATPWDLLYISLSPSLPSQLQPHLISHYTLQTGIPSRLTSSFHSHNATLLHPPPNSVPPLTGALSDPQLGASAQTLELSGPLLSWIDGFKAHASAVGSGAVSMLNFLAFKPEKGHHDAYKRYGAAFASSIGKRRGGEAKLVGNVVRGSEGGKREVVSREQGNEWAGVKGVEAEVRGWDEFALAHYPSIEHFADMLASKDYQEVNLRERVPSLRDTCILCTSEIAVEEIMKGQDGARSRL